MGTKKLSEYSDIVKIIVMGSWKIRDSKYKYTIPGSRKPSDSAPLLKIIYFIQALLFIVYFPDIKSTRFAEAEWRHE